MKLGRSILKYMAGDNIEANYHEEIYRLMTMDALTQTHNRRYFNEALEREYNRSLRYRRSLSLILFDIDHFKKINDTYGHVAGDSVLRQLALVVKPRLRQQDVPRARRRRGVRGAPPRGRERRRAHRGRQGPRDRRGRALPRRQQGVRLHRERRRHRRSTRA